MIKTLFEQRGHFVSDKKILLFNRIKTTASYNVIISHKNTQITLFSNLYKVLDQLILYGYDHMDLLINCPHLIFKGVGLQMSFLQH